MSALAIAAIVFVCAFGSALMASRLRGALPQHHLSDDSIRVVTLGTGLVATLSALVLGLLISSAKTSFERIDDELTRTAARIVMLDRTLANYGPETAEARDLLRRSLTAAIDLIFPGEGSSLAKVDTPERVAAIEQFQRKLRELAPQTNAQRLLHSRALELGNEVEHIRWLLIAQQANSAVSVPFLVIVVLWLAIIFAGFGLATANNATVAVTLFVCALSVSTAIFLILELGGPLDGMLRISSAPMRTALEHLGGR
jgi:hypothetical protein